MDLETAIKKRRSIRKFKEEKFPEDDIKKALSLAVLAPNSSNTQTWDFHWVKSPEKKIKLIDACLNQSAARTASDIIVVSANHKRWKRAQVPLLNWVKAIKAPTPVISYYEKLIPFVYTAGIFNLFAPFKWLMFNVGGIFKPMMRSPITNRDLQEVAVKSAALACENFVLSITALGGATCMMEGFDEYRVKKLLKLKCSDKIVMAIAVGYEAERGTWGDQFRIPIDQVIHTH